ncbi:MAG: response regulator [Pseudomonadota bacterium]
MSQPKILVVDDEPDIRESIRFCLDQEGYEVITTTNGWEALGAVRATEPDLVILDVMLPKENGYRVSRMIKEDQRTGRLSKKAPVILLTGRNLQGDPEREKMFMEFSLADTMIYKPFDIKELIEQVRELLA